MRSKILILTMIDFLVVDQQLLIKLNDNKLEVICM